MKQEFELFVRQDVVLFDNLLGVVLVFDPFALDQLLDQRLVVFFRLVDFAQCTKLLNRVELHKKDNIWANDGFLDQVKGELGDFVID